MNREILSGIEQILKDESNIIFAYIFGSNVKNTKRYGSDLDIAVYFKNEPEILDIGVLALKLEGASNYKVDLVSLNGLEKSDPILAYSIISDGKIATVKNKLILSYFKKAVILNYLDFKPVNDLFNKNFSNRLMNNKFAVFEK
jgi:predicted nucleotidyltransferase